MSFEIVRNDITKMKVDAIVNSANPHICIGDGVDWAIHTAAGPRLFEECKKIGNILRGQAVVTPAFKLKAKYVIHTVGPSWRGGTENEMGQLKDCYQNALALAVENGCKSIAFPLISTGNYHFPRAEALDIAVSTIRDFLFLNEMKVFLVVYDPETYVLSENRVEDVKTYIDDHYVEAHPEWDEIAQNLEEPTRLEEKATKYKSIIHKKASHFDKLMESSKEPVSESFLGLDELTAQLEESFSESVLRLIKKSGATDAQIYKKANISRKLFSKIRNNKHYKPSKKTALALAIALELNLDETKDLIGRAGFALSHSNLSDIIIEYFIKHEEYDTYQIDAVLFEFDKSTLFSEE